MYRLRGQHKHISIKTLAGIATAGVLAVVGFYTVSGIKRAFVHAAPDPNITVEALWPSNNATVDGDVTLRSTVHGLSPDQYESFWSVDNGTWNRMGSDPNNAQVALDTINVSGWKWHADDTYAITFTALIKGTWQPVQTTVQMKVGTAATPPPTAVSVPTAPAPVATAAPAASPAPAQTTATAATSASSSFGSSDLYTNPGSDVAKQALAYAQSDPSDAGRLQRLAAQPIAEWFGNWNSDIQSAVNSYVSAADAANKVPVLVAYNIPNRDCGGYSAGGANGNQGYLDWMRAFTQGINGRRAMVILEPDAISNLDCLSSSDQQNRLQLLGRAVSMLKGGSQTKVYLDAGHPNWIPEQTMATRLQSADIAQADGFSVNISNFIGTPDNVNYATQISNQVGGKHFVIDTSRNGNGATSDSQWCNPAGRAVGQAPTLQTGNAAADAYLWVKGPGASDGSCGPAVNGSSAPSAGTWWPQYALELLRNANW